MKHLIFLFFTFITCIGTSKAQVTISTSDLMGTKWQTAYDYDNQLKDYYEFTQGIIIYHTNKGTTFQYPYYLSETEQTKFDYTKVGIITKGKYIISTNPKWGIVDCRCIKDFYKGDGTMVLGHENETLFILTPSNKPRNQLSKQKNVEKW